MTALLRERREDIARAMRGLCDSLGALALIRDELHDEMQGQHRHSETDDVLLLKLTRTCQHLTESAVDVPDEFWAIMLSQESVGGEELRKRLEALFKQAA